MSKEKHLKVKTTLLIGPRKGETIFGISELFEMLIAGFEAFGLKHMIVNISNNPDSKIGGFSIYKAAKMLSAILSVWVKLPRVQNVYITVSLSLFGFFRDYLIIIPAYVLNKRIILHVKSGGYGDFFQQQTPLFKRIIISALSKATKIIVLGDLIVDQFKFLPGYLNKIEVVYNGLPLGLDHEQNSTKSIQPEKGFRLLFLSNMLPSKGYLDVLDACRILVHGYSLHVYCDFCGEFLSIITEESANDIEKLKSDFNSKMINWELTDNVTYHGRVSGRKKIELFQNAHIFTLPTNYPWEGQPIPNHRSHVIWFAGDFYKFPFNTRTSY